MNLLGSTKTYEPTTITFKVNCLAYVDKMLLINKYKIKVGFFYTKENQILSEMVLDQIEVFFSLLIENCIIIDKAAYDAMQEKFENNFFMVDDRPHDQVIACALFLKLVSIVGDNLSIEYLSLSSKLGDKICYTIDSESEEIAVMLPTKEEWWKEDIKHEPWWLRKDTATYDKLTDDGEIFEGEFKWEEMFKDELEAATKADTPKSKTFTIISGGKDAN